MGAKFLFTCLLLLTCVVSGQADQKWDRQGSGQAKTVKPPVTTTSKTSTEGKTSDKTKNNEKKNCKLPFSSCEENGITFWLHKKDKEIRIDAGDKGSIMNLEHGKKDPWKLIIPGYRDFNENVVKTIADAYFKKGNYNIMSVNYTSISKEKCFKDAMHYVPMLAKCTSKLLQKMDSAEKLSIEKLHVIGFGFGAQISGHLVKHFENVKVNRITALDPSRPPQLKNIRDRLRRKDATFIDVIHTNIGRIGKYWKTGHVDFYPNGGFIQPGCRFKSAKKRDACSHVRAVKYFAESINSKAGFWAYPCKSYKAKKMSQCQRKKSKLIQMGEYTPMGAKGIYYLGTKGKKPYAMGKSLKKPD